MTYGGGLASVDTYPLSTEWVHCGVVEVRGIEPLPVLVGTRPARQATPDFDQTRQLVSVPQRSLADVF